MSGLGVLFILILISSIPVIAVYFWFRIASYPFSLIRFLISLLAGGAAFFPALIFQNFFPAGAVAASAGRWDLFSHIFIRVALTEELSRLIILLIFFQAASRFEAGTAGAGFSAAPSGTRGGPDPALSYRSVTLGAAAGLIAGLGFAVLESAAYGASDANIVLLRAFTSAPLHGACGSRVGAAAVLFRKSPPQAVFRFLSAVIIHGIYNFMIVMPGFPSIAAILIALSAIASSILTIRGGMRDP